MFEKLGSLIVNRKRLIFSLFIVAIFSSGAIGTSVFGKLDSGGYNDPKSDSAKAFEYLTDVFKVKDPAVVLVVETTQGVNDPAVVAAAAKLETSIKGEPGVGSTLSYWSAGGAPTLKSSDSNSAFLFIYSEDIEWDNVQSLGKRIQEKYDGRFENLAVYATGLGLGLGIDYSLLVVNRFREELHAGKTVDEAIKKTVATAGKTVFYSGLTVVITLAALMLFPLMYLKSFGYAGVTVVVMAVLGALIALPALLAILGKRIDKAVVRKGALTPKEDGRWAQTARFVMRKPVPVVVLSLVILTVLAAPIKNIVFSQVDSRVLPASNPAAYAAQLITERFPGQEGNPIEVIIPGGASKIEQIKNYTQEIAKVAGVVRVGEPQILGNDVRVIAVHDMGPRTPAAEALIKEIRLIPSPDQTLIGGVAADYADTQIGIAKTMPWALTWIAIGVLVLLFVFTGSLILPIKAVVLNILSLAATLGVITWIFVEGNLKWLVGDFTTTGSVDTGSIILVAVVAFGLSMDYELFLLSRIKEEHDAGRSNIESVATGLQRSARIITAAAGLLAIVFASFVLSGVTSIKMLGFGVAFAIILDATLVRALLVPALMRLFGERNWWAPKAMRKFTISH